MITMPWSYVNLSILVLDPSIFSINFRRIYQNPDHFNAEYLKNGEYQRGRIFLFSKKDIDLLNKISYKVCQSVPKKMELFKRQYQTKRLEVD